MSETFYFHIKENLIYIVGKSFWEMEKTLDESYISDFITEQLGENSLSGFSEKEKSVFSLISDIPDIQEKEIVKKLKKRGFKTDLGFSKFIKNL